MSSNRNPEIILQEIESIVAENAVMIRQLDELKGSHARLEKSLGALKAEKSEQTAAYKQLRTKFHEADSEFQQLRARAEALESELPDLRADRDRLHSELKSLAPAFEWERKRAWELERNNEALIEDRQRSHLKMQKVIEDERDGFLIKLMQQESAYELLNQRYADAQKYYESTLNHLRQETALRDERLARTGGESTLLTEEVAALTKRTEQLNAQLSEMDDLRKRLEIFESRAMKAEAECQRIRSALAAANEETQAEKRRNTELSERSSEAERLRAKAITETHEVISQFTKERERLHQDLRSAIQTSLPDSQIVNLEAAKKMRQTESDLQSLRRLQVEQDVELTRLQAANKNLSAERDALCSEVKRLKDGFPIQELIRSREIQINAVKAELSSSGHTAEREKLNQILEALVDQKDRLEKWAYQKTST